MAADGADRHVQSRHSPMRLYNTLTRSKDDFVPIDPKNVRLYVCGPTVYDYAHIGNARPIIVFDLLFRLLRHVYGTEAVTYVRNITDVDDKINARAARDFPDLQHNDAIRLVTQKTEEQFHADIRALGVLMPDDVNEAGKPLRFVEPRATEHGGPALLEALQDHVLVEAGLGHPGGVLEMVGVEQGQVAVVEHGLAGGPGNGLVRRRRTIHADDDGAGVVQ